MNTKINLWMDAQNLLGSGLGMSHSGTSLGPNLCPEDVDLDGRMEGRWQRSIKRLLV